MESVSSRQPGLLRAIGLFGLAATIFNCTVGGGIFRLPGAVFAISGIWTPLAHMVCGLVILGVGLCFARLGAETLKSGGPYAYVERTFGPYAGMLTGVLIWLLGTLSMASVATAYAASVGRLLPVTAGDDLRALVLLLTMGLVAWINVRGVRQGTRLILLVTVAKLVPLLILLLVGMVFLLGDSAAVAPIAATSFDSTSFTRACMLMIFAYTGIESALVPSGEVIDPRKTVPRAILLGLVGVVFLYLVLQLIAQAVLGSALATAVQTPLADVAERLLGAKGKVLLLVGAMVSMFGYLCAMTLAIPRCLFAFAQDGLLPRWLAQVHPRTQTPTAAIVTQALLVAVLAISSTFEKLAIIANLAAVLAYLLCVAAAWKLTFGMAATRRQYLRASFVPAMTLLVMLWLLTSITVTEWIWCFGCLALASLAYVVKGHRSSHQANESV